MAKALAYGDDGWLRVGHEMVEEITKKLSSYSPLQGGDRAVCTIIDRIKVKTLKTKITKEKWLDKLSHGHFLANTYTQPIVFISLKQLATFFPLG
jgi:hypothetical protein